MEKKRGEEKEWVWKYILIVYTRMRKRNLQYLWKTCLVEDICLNLYLNLLHLRVDLLLT